MSWGQEDPAQLMAQAVQAYDGGRLAEAEQLCGRVLELDPHSADATNMLGALAHSKGDMPGALRYMEKAAELQPDNPDHFYNISMLHTVRGDRKSAVAALDTLLAIAPMHANGLRSRLQMAMEDKEFARAEALLKGLQKALPDNAEVLSLLMQALCGQEKYEEALPLFPKLAAANPRRDDSYFCNYGSALNVAGRFQEAIDTVEDALAHGMQSAKLYFIMGRAYENLGDFERAAFYYDESLKLDQAFKDAKAARWALGMKTAARLEDAIGSYGERFVLTEHRQRLYPISPWKGEPLAGKSILLTTEQGIGDVVMFAGFIPHLLAEGAKPSLAAHPRIMPLFAHSFGIPILSLAPEEEAKLLDMPFDYHAPMGDMMRYRLKEYKPGQHPPYLKPDPARAAQIKARYDALLPGFKVGIAWDTVNPVSGRVRNIPLDRWGPVFSVPGCRFVSLQYGFHEEAIAACEARFNSKIFTDADVDQVNHPADFIAQIAALDMVIGIQNSATHFGGAIGVPTVLMLPVTSDFRWGITRSGRDNDWYASVSVLRQKRYGDWQQVLEEAAGHLRAEILKVSRDDVRR